MKTLLIMRHAKSSFKDPTLTDPDRPLNKRGKKEAPMMGEWVKDQELIPQTILSSPALRASQTAHLLAETCEFKQDIVYVNSLYLGEPEAYIGALKGLPDSIERVMVIGHNPGLEGLLQQLSGQVQALPPASIAYLALPISQWQTLTLETECELMGVFYPDLTKNDDADKDHGKKEKEKLHKNKKEKGKEKNK